jgi:hypothetical protein
LVTSVDAPEKLIAVIAGLFETHVEEIAVAVRQLLAKTAS